MIPPTPRDDIPRLLLELLKHPRQLSEFLRYGAGAGPESPNYGRGWTWRAGGPYTPGQYQPNPEPTGLFTGVERRVNTTLPRTKLPEAEVIQPGGTGSKIVRAARTTPSRPMASAEPPPRFDIPGLKVPQMEPVPNVTRWAGNIGAMAAGAPILDYLIRLAGQRSLVDQTRRKYGAKKETA